MEKIHSLGGWGVGRVRAAGLFYSKARLTFSWRKKKASYYGGLSLISGLDC